MKALLTTAGTVVVLLVAACAGGPTDLHDAPVAAPTGGNGRTIPFHIDVTNQSFDVPTVRISITLDDELLLDEQFSVDSQHNVVRFDFSVEPGDHTVTVSAPERDEHYEAALTMTDEVWANVSYWGPDKAEEPFTWRTASEPFVYG